MGRHKVHNSPAERQRAYRLRLRSGQSPVRVVTPTNRRPPSRLKRLAALLDEAQRLQEEYVGWLESLPEALQDTDVANRLREVVGQFAAVAELLSEIAPPRGFGRD